jgi:hypothetical protein
MFETKALARPSPARICGVLLRKPLTQKTLRSMTPEFEFPNSLIGLIGREQFVSVAALHVFIV